MESLQHTGEKPPLTYSSASSTMPTVHPSNRAEFSLFVHPNPTSLLTLVQCFHCYEHGHVRPQCPLLHLPTSCSRCGDVSHNHTDCLNPPKCGNCQGGHPITSRACPTYIKKHRESLLQAVQFMFRTPSYSAEISQLNISAPFPTTPTTPPETTLQDMSSLCTAAYNTARTAINPYDFVTNFYHALRNEPDQNHSSLSVDEDAILSPASYSTPRRKTPPLLPPIVLDHLDYDEELGVDDDIKDLTPISAPDSTKNNDSTIENTTANSPGSPLDTSSDFNHKHDRNPLFEMPLAINPTGCARSEPFNINMPQSPCHRDPIAREMGSALAKALSNSTIPSSKNDLSQNQRLLELRLFLNAAALHYSEPPPKPKPTMAPKTKCNFKPPPRNAKRPLPPLDEPDWPT